MEYLIAVVCAVAPLALGFWLNRRYSDRSSAPREQASAEQPQEPCEVLSPAKGAEAQAGGAATQEIRPATPAPESISTPAIQALYPQPEAPSKLERVEQRTGFSTAPEREKSSSAKRAAVVLEPKHFERHSGVPGFLYLARNDERREHLYKIGYTTGLPQGRIKNLNEQVDAAVDIGSFRLIHSVPVGSSYDMEQALFEALIERRVIGEREFFFGPEEALIRAMNALVRLPQDGGESINEFLASEPWGELGGPPPAVLAECPIPERFRPEGGWIYLCQNFWHRPGTAYYSVSKETPTAVVKRLNEAQSGFTSQLGFYRIVACRAVDSTETAKQHAQVLFAPYRIDSRKQFVRAPLDVLRTIVESINGGEPQPVRPAKVRTPRSVGLPPLAASKHGPIAVDLVMGLAAPKQWAPWTARCEQCNTLLRYRGVIGERAPASCPFCQTTVVATIGASQVHIERP